MMLRIDMMKRISKKINQSFAQIGKLGIEFHLSHSFVF